MIICMIFGAIFKYIFDQARRAGDAVVPVLKRNENVLLDLR